MLKAAVWLSRLLVGAVFLVSGVTKMVDLHGSINKITDYLAAWDMSDLFPRGLLLVGAGMLCLVEFLTGLLLATGSMRRSAPIVALLLMLFMLPLTAYIWIVAPVEDCGCFGDFWVISNGATFAKNLLITALVIFLCRYNRRADCLFAPWVQWMETAVGVAYMVVVGTVGYAVQPLLDFRPYPAGGPLLDSDAPEVTYVYADASGERHEFSAYDLPNEADGWEFVETIEGGHSEAVRSLAVIDPATGGDITDEVVGVTPEQAILVIPDPEYATIAGSYTANEFNSVMTRRFGRGSFFALMDGSDSDMERWRDMAMAAYPIYFAEATALKTVVRGDMALVYLRGDSVMWKRSLPAIDPDVVNAVPDLATAYGAGDRLFFWTLTLVAVMAEMVVWSLGNLTRVRRMWLRVSRTRRRRGSRGGTPARS